MQNFVVGRNFTLNTEWQSNKIVVLWLDFCIMIFMSVLMQLQNSRELFLIMHCVVTPRHYFIDFTAEKLACI